MNIVIYTELLAPRPDFYIAAHAAVANLSVLKRNRAAYAGYFPGLAVIRP